MSGNQSIQIGDVNSIINGRHGLFLANKFDFYVGLALIKYGEYGELEWQVLAQLLNAGNTVVEVGANIGSHTVSMARLVGPTGRVVAIEPQRIVFQYLCANLALNTLGHVEAYWAGCGAEPGPLMVPRMDYFAPTYQNFGGISLSLDGEGEVVPILRLDDIMRDRPVDLLKIDVEGMELQVLQGAAHVIATKRPIIYLENDRVEKSDALISQLWSMNYRTYWHIPPLYNPNNFYGDAENIYGKVTSFNMLCIPEDSTLCIKDFLEARTLGAHPLRNASLT